MGTLRILLAIAIIVSHTVLIEHSSLFGITLLDGYSAVRAFFIMSGFYMWMILNEKYIGLNNGYRLFITNRFLRVYPAYWAVLGLTILTIIIGALFFKQIPNPLARYISFGHLFSPGVDAVLIFSNLFIFGQDVLTFLGVDCKHGGTFVLASTHGFLNFNFILLPQSWALATELIFYLLVPVLAQKSIKLTAALIVVVVAAKLGLNNAGSHYLDWQFPPFEIVFFLLGGVSYFIYRQIKQLRFTKWQLYSIWMLILSFTVLYQFIPTDNVKRWVYYGAFAIALPFIFNLTKNYRWDRYIGELSYPFFLVQYLVFNVLQVTALPVSYLAANSVVCCLILAIIIYHVITIPVERIRQHRVKPKTFTDTTMPASWKQ